MNAAWIEGPPVQIPLQKNTKLCDFYVLNSLEDALEELPRRPTIKMRCHFLTFISIISSETFHVL